MIKPKRSRKINLVWSVILLSILTAACSLIDVSRPAISPTATPAKTLRSSRGVALTPTLQPTPSPTITPPPSPSPVTRQGDKIPRSSQGDTLLPRPSRAPTHEASVAIRCAVAAETLNLREGPTINYTTITTLSSGTVLTARKCFPGAEWLLVETNEQTIGWVKTAGLACQDDPAILPVAVGITPR